ncbi:MAG: EAL domain-containing protein [Eggerthella sp.]|nr:EAL domain-containing protein [Eggerthella sp.]
MCDDLSIESVAEGIETEQQLEALKTTGCTRAQGYLIGRPSAIDEFERRFMA